MHKGVKLCTHPIFNSKIASKLRECFLLCVSGKSSLASTDSGEKHFDDSIW